MGKCLIIAEKPSVANDIAKALGGFTKQKDYFESDPVLTAMGFDPVSIDALLERLKLPTDQLVARVTELELDGAIASMPGGKYQRLR